MEKHSPLESESLMAILKEKVASLNLANSEIARLSGKSTSTVSQVLSGKYQGREGVVKEILDSLEETQTARSSGAKMSTKKWLTSGEELIYGVLSLTYHAGALSTVVGPSGLGKTFTAMSFAKEHKDVVYMRCSDGMSMGDTIEALLDAVGVKAYGTRTQRLKRAIEALKNKGIRMLMVDEADLLVTDYGNKSAVLKKISVFREVKEAGIGVAMIGLESFDTTLRVVGETYVTSRIDYFRRVKDPSYEELAYYLANQGWNPELPDAQNLISMAPARGLFRFLEKLTQAAKYLGSLTDAVAVSYAIGGGTSKEAK